jgi:DNA polymerase III subunit delta'
VDGFLTVGHPAAVAAVHAMLGGDVPHAVLLVGPASVGKTSLALDLAAALLCTGAAGGDRPCRACRACRMVAHGNHPDLHQLGPTGPGLQVRIGEDQHPEPGTVRRLVVDLALLPVEGVARVAIVRDAQRMNDVAQSALLKTLEEPPSGTTLVLCADDDELLLPTIRSRCARIRLGTVETREIERLLADRGLADAPAAARLARLTGGRPGVAVAYAIAPGAAAIRAEIERTLLDLLGAGRAARLAAARPLQARAGELAAQLASAQATVDGTAVPPAAAPGATRRGARPGAGPGPAPSPEARADDAGEPGAGEPGAGEPGAGEATSRVSAGERRRALGVLLGVWRDLARDLVLVERGAAAAVRDPALLEELESAAARLEPGVAAGFLARAARADELVTGNVTPELVLDVLLLRWPVRRRAA